MVIFIDINSPILIQIGDYQIIQDGVGSFRFVGAYGSVRFAKMIGSFRFVSHLFNIFSVSFRFVSVSQTVCDFSEFA